MFEGFWSQRSPFYSGLIGARSALKLKAKCPQKDPVNVETSGGRKGGCHALASANALSNLILESLRRVVRGLNHKTQASGLHYTCTQDPEGMVIEFITHNNNIPLSLQEHYDVY